MENILFLFLPASLRPCLLHCLPLSGTRPRGSVDAQHQSTDQPIEKMTYRVDCAFRLTHPTSVVPWISACDTELYRLVRKKDLGTPAECPKLEIFIIETSPALTMAECTSATGRGPELKTSRRRPGTIGCVTSTCNSDLSTCPWPRLSNTMIPSYHFTHQEVAKKRVNRSDLVCVFDGYIYPRYDKELKNVESCNNMEKGKADQTWDSSMFSPLTHDTR